jgi:antitoxin (DNA-binding transcriptional repressor) of toxin-antitoxin stability system
MPTVTLDDIQARFPEVLAGLGPGESIAVVQDGQEVAVITRSAAADEAPRPRRPGRARGKLVLLQEDDEHLRDFAEYME